MILETLSQCSFVSDSVCGAITDITTHIITNFLTFIVGGVIAFIGYILYTKPSTIRRKTKAANKQKLEINSIVGIIDGTEELKSAISDMEYRMELALDNIRSLLEESESKGTRPLREAVYDRKLEMIIKFEEVFQESSKKIKKFIFLLEKDMMVNEENEMIKKEIEKIKSIHEKMQYSFYSKNESSKKLNKYQLTDIVFSNLMETFKKKKISKAIDKSIENILKIYKAKLN